MRGFSHDDVSDGPVCGEIIDYSKFHKLMIMTISGHSELFQGWNWPTVFFLFMLLPSSRSSSVSRGASRNPISNLEKKHDRCFKLGCSEKHGATNFNRLVGHGSWRRLSIANSPAHLLRLQNSGMHKLWKLHRLHRCLWLSSWIRWKGLLDTAYRILGLIVEELNLILLLVLISVRIAASR
ncbi:hypothetical protein BC830DRAFT_46981 [Chytriomyces sp. MP71]|nr:hypothetical protein BC830DRAFT_46981 [Chytriomyces sp. MP71]